MTESRIRNAFGDERNADGFRLVIVGFAIIEDALRDALNDACGGELPYMTFRARLALAEALRLMPADFRSPLLKLKEVRDKLAHPKRGTPVELTEQNGREFFAATLEIVPELADQIPALKRESQPETHLINLLLFLEFGLLESFDEAREERARQEEAMREWWERRRGTPLTLKAITELLENEERRTDDVSES